MGRLSSVGRAFVSVGTMLKLVRVSSASPSDKAFSHLQHSSLPRRVQAEREIVDLALNASPGKRREILARLAAVMKNPSPAALRALDAFESIAREISGHEKERQALRRRKEVGEVLRDLYRGLRDGSAGHWERRSLASIFNSLNDRSGLGELVHDSDPRIREVGLEALKAKAVELEDFHVIPVLLRHCYDPEIYEILTRNIRKVERQADKRQTVERFLEKYAPSASKKCPASSASAFSDTMGSKARLQQMQQESLEIIKKHYPDYYDDHIRRHAEK